MEIKREIKRIERLKASDENVVFSSNDGPCRYCKGESYEIRTAKHDKILESIECGQMGPNGRRAREIADYTFRSKLESGD